MNHTKELELKRNIQEDQQILTFQLNGESFGLQILKVKELLEYNSIAKVPMVPDCIRGVINLRGSVVPVVDLMHLFSNTPSEITKKSCIIIADNASGDTVSSTGILVDSVDEVIEIRGKDIDPPPSFGENLKTSFILGMARAGEEIIILLDMDYLLSSEGLSGLSRLDFKSLYEKSRKEH